jgi:hypothetical protein
MSARWPKLRLNLRNGPALLAALALVLTFTMQRGALAFDSVEPQVKAAMLYNFTHFVEWPSSTWKDASTPVVLGVVGPDSFAQLVEIIVKDRRSSGRSIQVRRTQRPTESKGCQLLFVSSSEKKHMGEYLRAAEGNGILTVSDLPGFVQAGGMIEFVLVDGSVHFEINAAAANKAGLMLSSDLLRLAVSGERPGGGN